MITGVDSHGTNISAGLFIRLAGGGLAGITAASVTYPLDLVRTRLSAQVGIQLSNSNLLIPFFNFLYLHVLSSFLNIFADKCYLL